MEPNREKQVSPNTGQGIVANPYQPQVFGPQATPTTPSQSPAAINIPEPQAVPASDSITTPTIPQPVTAEQAPTPQVGAMPARQTPQVFTQPAMGATAQTSDPSSLNPTPTNVSISSTEIPQSPLGLQPMFGAASGLSAAPPNKKKPLIIAAGITAVVILAGVGGVFGLYLPSTPENVWKNGLNRTGETMESLVAEATTKERMDAYKTSELTGTFEATSSDFSVKGNLGSKQSLITTDTNLDIALTSDGQTEKTLNIDIMSELAEGKLLPDMYVRVAGIQEMGLGMFFPEIGQYENRWIVLSSDYLESVVNTSETKNEFTADDVAEVAGAASGVTREYVFSTEQDKAVLTMKEFVKTEKTSDGITAHQYKVMINKDNARKYCKAMVEAVMETNAYKKLEEAGSSYLYDSKERALKDCDEGGNDKQEDAEFDMWIDKQRKLIHKVRIESDSSGEYMEFGQAYTGGDEMPLFVRAISDKEESNGELKLVVNRKTSVVKGNFNFADEGSNEYQVTIDFEFKPIDGEVTIEKPTDAVPIQTILQQLGMDDVLGRNTTRRAVEPDKDSERQQDLSDIRQALNGYYEKHGSYPQINQLNDKLWRLINARNVSDESMKDPDGSAYLVGPRSTSNRYGYSCIGSEGCKAYALSAILSNGKPFTLSDSR